MFPHTTAVGTFVSKDTVASVRVTSRGWRHIAGFLDLLKGGFLSLPELLTMGRIPSPLVSEGELGGLLQPSSKVCPRVYPSHLQLAGLLAVGGEVQGPCSLRW